MVAHEFGRGSVNFLSKLNINCAVQGLRASLSAFTTERLELVLTEPSVCCSFGAGELWSIQPVALARCNSSTPRRE